MNRHSRLALVQARLAADVVGSHPSICGVYDHKENRMKLPTAAKTRIQTLRWTARDCEAIEAAELVHAPALDSQNVRRVTDNLDIWDAWPLADVEGRPVAWRGGELWFALAAPTVANPELRHFEARIHHFHRIGNDFHLLGPTFPKRWSPGNREWSGSARLIDDQIALYFTAAGVKGESTPSYRQRMFCARTRMVSGSGAIFGPWSEPQELLSPGGPYLEADDSEGSIGKIKAFRDPCPWRSSDGRDYLLFTGSSAVEPGPFNGVIGVAEADHNGTWHALPPLVDAAGVNNELERPHIVAHDSRLYLFWSTQASVFAPGIEGRTGLYGASAAAIEGPWEFLNGHGLVFANPKREPFQSYSWWVLPDLSVASFIDYWGIDNPDAATKPSGRGHFGGTFAPFLHLELDGGQARLVDGARR